MDTTVNLVNWTEFSEQLRIIRDQVFIVEQNVPEDLERDPADTDYIHALARDEKGNDIATGRLLPDGKIGRMAVLQPWRGKGVGRAVLDCLVDAARHRGDKEVYLDAQIDARNFYTANGFVAEGEEFMDAGIRHIRMRRPI